VEQAQATTLGTVAQAPGKCDRDCSQTAVFAYTWEWGEKGVCCAEHQFLLQQTAGNLSRSINFAPIQSSVVVPMGRDERVKLKAEVYALEEESNDLRARGSLLYAENTALTRQVQAATTRLRETETLLTEDRAELVELRARLEERDAEHGSLVDELQRLRTLAKFSEPPRPVPSFLQPTQNVVDGESVVGGAGETSAETSKKGSKPKA
jgi:hypothetical protein